MPIDLPIDKTMNDRYLSYPGFLLFWEAYPNKAAKNYAFRCWVIQGCEPYADQITQDVQQRSQQDRSWLDGYIPNPSTYINQHRWQDPIQAQVKATKQEDWLTIGEQKGIQPRVGENWNAFIARVQQHHPH